MDTMATRKRNGRKECGPCEFLPLHVGKAACPHLVVTSFATMSGGASIRASAGSKDAQACVRLDPGTAECPHPCVLHPLLRVTHASALRFPRYRLWHWLVTHQ